MVLLAICTNTPNITDQDADQPGTITFMIKRYPGGKGSGKMHSLVPGDTMKFKTLHEFDYKPNQFKHMTLIAGGSGITPIYQLTNAILQNPADKTKISLIYANNTPEDVLLKDEFEELERKFPGRFQKLFTVSKNGGGDGLHQGYVTKDLLTKASPTKSDKVLVSGPPHYGRSNCWRKRWLRMDTGIPWWYSERNGLYERRMFTSSDVQY